MDARKVKKKKQKVSIGPVMLKKFVVDFLFMSCEQVFGTITERERAHLDKQLHCSKKKKYSQQEFEQISTGKVKFTTKIALKRQMALVNDEE